MCGQSNPLKFLKLPIKSENIMIVTGCTEGSLAPLMQHISVFLAKYQRWPACALGLGLQNVNRKKFFFHSLFLAVLGLPCYKVTL